MQEFKLSKNHKDIINTALKQGATPEKIQEIKDRWQEEDREQKAFNEKWLSCPALEQYAIKRSLEVFKHILSKGTMDRRTLATIINNEYERHVKTCPSCLK